MQSDYADRLAMIRTHVPQLFSDPGSVLYIGARKTRCDYVQELYDAGNKIYVIEAFADNVLSMAGDPRVFSTWLLDVRDIKSFGWKHKSFEYTMAWHGPEHWPIKDAYQCILDLENLTSNTIVLGTPLGRVPQGKAYDNPYERHVSSWMPEDFEAIGYRTASIGERGAMGSCILAWKEMR